MKEGQPHNAGTFLVQDGTVALKFTFEPSEYDTVAITHEPDAGEISREGEIVLAAAFMNEIRS
ncbi:hypothetical protein I6N90_20820 [Paenibacillus sp. GSMTC-2017]|nr:hypothetical protein [Paenibacillus sp. GSMTC-2017]